MITVGDVLVPTRNGLGSLLIQGADYHVLDVDRNGDVVRISGPRRNGGDIANASWFGADRFQPSNNPPNY